jgi:hypothetical protein
MSMTNHGHAAMLQLIAEGMRSPAADRLSREHLERVAGLLDRIAVDLLVPTPDDGDDEANHLMLDVAGGAPLHN